MLRCWPGCWQAGPAFAQVAAPKTAPPPKLTFAQIGLFIYPARDQSADQQKKDEDACYGWAETNTGLTLVAGQVDAEAAGKAAAKDAGKGKVAGGAAAGAATGPAIGAIAGDAGKGAAIGAVAGSVGGVRGRAKAKRAAGQKGAAAGRPGESTGCGPVQESGGRLSRGAGLLRQMTRWTRETCYELRCRTARRRFLAASRVGAFPGSGLGACASSERSASAQTGTGGRGSLTKEQRDRMTPGQVLDALKAGQRAFSNGHHGVPRLSGSAADQRGRSIPAAVVLGCIDSRAPAEIIFDAGIGDTFNARIAGNVVNDDLLGAWSSPAPWPAPVLLLFGHTACGAIKGAIDVEMGNLTGLLARVKPAISGDPFDGAKSSKTPPTSTP